MRSKSIGFHEAAFEEAKAAYGWYASQNLAAAEAFMAELDDAIEQIGAFPDAGSLYLSGTRRHVLRRFPFAVIYREQKRAVEVIAVAHGHRKPGYWRKRLKH